MNPENSDPAAIQCWRSMNVEAIFQMNDGVESQVYEELISNLERMLKLAFSLPSSPRSKVKPDSLCKSIVHRTEISLGCYPPGTQIIIYDTTSRILPLLQVQRKHLQMAIIFLKRIPLDYKKILGPDRTILVRTIFVTKAQLRTHLL